VACAEELVALAEELKLEFEEAPVVMAAGVRFKATWEVGVAANVGLRSASRVLMPLASGLIDDLNDVYEVAKAIPWSDIFGIEKTFSVGAQVASAPITNSMSVALKIKDALADVFRENGGQRPNVDTQHPDIRIAARVLGPELEISLNLSGDALSQRGYRVKSAAAPLRENLAAGMLHYTGYSKFCAELSKPGPHKYVRIDEDAQNQNLAPEKGRKIPPTILWSPVLVDPMCGSGTILIEAAHLLLNRRENAHREHFSFLHLKWGQRLAGVLRWVQTELIAKERSVAEVHAMAQTYFNAMGIPWKLGQPFLMGWDTHLETVLAARQNATAAGVQALINVQQGNCFAKSAPVANGLVVVNPPYGERMEAEADIAELYSKMGDLWKKEYKGWMCWILSSHTSGLKKVGLRATRRVSVYNGNLPCGFHQFIIY
jgi:putative N6-adenine-specific DNA methylase